MDEPRQTVVEARLAEQSSPSRHFRFEQSLSFFSFGSVNYKTETSFCKEIPDGPQKRREILYVPDAISKSSGIAKYILYDLRMASRNPKPISDVMYRTSRIVIWQLIFEHFWRPMHDIENKVTIPDAMHGTSEEEIYII